MALKKTTAAQGSKAKPSPAKASTPKILATKAKATKAKAHQALAAKKAAPRAKAPAKKPAAAKPARRAGASRPEANSMGMKLVLLPAGSFTMGSPLTEKGRGTDEGQQRVTILTPFLISRTVVTNGVSIKQIRSVKVS